VAIGLVLLWTVQRSLIYFPFGGVPEPAEVGLRGAELIGFTTDDGVSLAGWFVPATTATTLATVIVFNGNAGHRGLRAPLAARLAEQGLASLLFDYRGYGGNPGSPSEEGLARDARAARRYLASRADVDQSRIVYLGESLGTGAAVRLASESLPHALILRSPFTSLVDVGRHHYPFLPVRWLLRDRFPSIDLIGDIACPVLIIAAQNDSIVPAALSERLYAAAAEPKRLVILDGVDHNDAELLDGREMIKAIVDFVRLAPSH
jgi:uncharacterized protein